MFWEKCGKLIADSSGKLIDCDFSPCPAYAVFAFVERSLTPANPDGTVSNCSSSYAYAMPCEIKNGHICTSDMYGGGGKKKIKLHSEDFEGKCGYWKGCTGEWQDCAEWDENGENCIREETYYDGCVQVKVYRLTPCFEEFSEFKQAFFEPCGFEGDFPEIFDSWGITGEAYDCLYNYWNKEAEKKKLQWKVNAVWFGDSYNFASHGMECVEEEVCYEVEPGVFDCWMECVEEKYYMLQMYNCSWGGGVSVPEPSGDENCDEACYNARYTAGVEEANRQLQEHENHPEKWSQGKSESRTEYCFSVRVEGGGSCYGCDAWSGCACNSFTWDNCSLVEFTIERPENIFFEKMPTGVKFLYKDRILERRWGEKIFNKTETEDKILFNGVGIGDCYGEIWNTCPDSASMDIRLELIEYIWN